MLHDHVLQQHHVQWCCIGTLRSNMTQQVISNMAIEKAAECARAATHWNFYDLILRFCSRYMDIACVEVDRACPPAHAALLVTQHLQHKHFADKHACACVCFVCFCFAWCADLCRPLVMSPCGASCCGDTLATATLRWHSRQLQDWQSDRNTAQHVGALEK
jgi:hypothetical protein